MSKTVIEGELEVSEKLRKLGVSEVKRLSGNDKKRFIRFQIKKKKLEFNIAKDWEDTLFNLQYVMRFERIEDSIKPHLEFFFTENKPWVLNGDNIGSSYAYLDSLIDKFKLKVPKGTRNIYYYDEVTGIYRSNGEEILEVQIEEDAINQQDEESEEICAIKTNKVKEFIDSITRRLLKNKIELDPDIKWIACENCMINLEDGSTASFNHKYNCTTKIPITFRSIPYALGYVANFFRMVEGKDCKHSAPDCMCPAIMQFLNEILSPKDVDRMLDLIAYCFWRDYKFHVWVLLVGDGSNGKSTLLYLLEQLIGEDNKSSESLDDLLHNKFAPAELYLKMLNVDADISTKSIEKNSGNIKKMTGNDKFRAERKYAHPFSFRNVAKLWFSCNTVPDTNDKTDAFFRRIEQFNFIQQFWGSKDDPGIKYKITTQRELSGMLIEIMSRLPNILKNGFGQNTLESVGENRIKYEKSQNPVHHFKLERLDDSTENARGEYISKDEMYKEYLEWCKAEGFTIKTPESFSSNLSAEGLHWEDKTIDKVRYFWVDVRFKSENPTEIDEELKETMK